MARTGSNIFSCDESYGSDGRTSCGSNGGIEPQGVLNFFSTSTEKRSTSASHHLSQSGCLCGGAPHGRSKRRCRFSCEAVRTFAYLLQQKRKWVASSHRT